MNSQFFEFPSPAKLNLFLHINKRRNDGYHELQTLFQFLDYGDTIKIKTDFTSNIELLTAFDNVKASDNLIIKAANLLRSSAIEDNTQNYRLGSKIEITKILPMGGGLGGGSSNAATVLLALNQLWGINFSLEKLARLGLKLGADVPVFIHGFAAFAEGVGEQLTAASPKEYWYLITKPKCSISTASVFNADNLPRNTPKLTLEQLNIEQCHNDCQTVVIKNYPEVANLLSWLVEYAPSQMTGTGACLFSRFDSKVAALSLQKKLPHGVISFVAKGLNTSPLIKTIAEITNIL